MTVSFEATADATYILEKSEDGKVWKTVKTVITSPGDICEITQAADTSATLFRLRLAP
ncbi:hypothetical protein OAG85_02775 [Verrucomicrobiales bacterium]|nr:hypothetical protein [Verrucomicrobiales bacterium]MDA7643965.1 hypothetical protein [Verrucomicrobiales bacterium]MDB4808833.1 hypothetical protein [Verrucomicrobiales bacterium]MDF1785965.1 hypothetical protein [Verrucomicrobiales bacterium]